MYRKVPTGLIWLRTAANGGQIKIFRASIYVTNFMIRKILI